jgi:urease accessory protein
VLLITTPRLAVDEACLAERERDTLCLGWEERRWTRRRLTTSGGREVALALPTGSVLEPGAIVAVEAGWYLVVDARPEPLLAVFPASHDEALRLAFDVGNRHFTLAMEGDTILVPDDLAMEQLVTRLGLRWERRQACYAPLGGAGDD